MSAITAAFISLKLTPPTSLTHMPFGFLVLSKDAATRCNIACNVARSGIVARCDGRFRSRFPFYFCNVACNDFIVCPPLNSSRYWIFHTPVASMRYNINMFDLYSHHQRGQLPTLNNSRFTLLYFVFILLYFALLYFTLPYHILLYLNYLNLLSYLTLPYIISSQLISLYFNSCCIAPHFT